MTDIALNQGVGDQVSQQALQFVQVKLIVPLSEREEEKVQLDEVSVTHDLQLWSCFDSIGNTFDEVLQRDHSQALNHSKHSRLDELLHIGRDGLLEALHISLKTRSSNLKVLDQIVPFEQALRRESAINHLDG